MHALRRLPFLDAALAGTFAARRGAAYNAPRASETAPVETQGMTATLPLAGGFPDRSEDEWRAAAARVRRTAPDAHSGSINPVALFQRRVGAHAIAAQRPGEAWRIVERIAKASVDETTVAVRAAIAGGATGVEIAFASSLHPLGGTLRSAAAAELARSIASHLSDGFLLRIDADIQDRQIAEAFVELGTARRVTVAFVRDPIAALALGRAPTPLPDEWRAAAAAAKRAATVLTADGRLWHAGGASEEQELAATLATFVSHVRLLESTDGVGFCLAVDANQFRGIAKLRAMRLLIARVLEVASLSPPAPQIHAETAWRMMSARDEEMNVLRATSAAFAAAVGGADSIAVLPFDAATNAEGNLARRLARNLQHILAEEAHLGRVSDPGAGSGAIEALTSAFAEAAWKRFQAIEAEGGMAAAIAEGSLLREIAEAREARLARVARGDIKLIGINAFRGEAAAAAVKRAPVKRTGPLTFKRLSADFERAP
jgi:methylmalonyl-CoA mutase